ncbi:hypothetical protein [Fodinicola feengrottensis]|uniref:hypothetical protein n=1 Tax=Fodinicola feengrottensis TaxID=435914 RepID=UPI0013CFC44F|nr:hypothetical protein [Fodinicola feengrottensis]
MAATWTAHNATFCTSRHSWAARGKNDAVVGGACSEHPLVVPRHRRGLPHLAEVYGAEVSKTTISTITDRVVEGTDVRETPAPGDVGD